MLGAGTAKRAAAVRMFIKNTSILHEVLGMMLKESLPEEWEVMHPVYKAGRWVREDTDNGFALGRAVIWKLQVDIHRDPQDGLGNICVVFNCGRYDKITKYDAGMAFPDLGLIFESVFFLLYFIILLSLITQISTRFCTHVQISRPLPRCHALGDPSMHRPADWSWKDFMGPVFVKER